MKIFLIIEQAYDSRNRNRFGEVFFEKEGIDFSVIDVTPITRPNDLKNGSHSEAINKSNIHITYDLKELKLILSSIGSKDVVINTVALGIRSIYLFFRLSLIGPIVTELRMGLIPDTCYSPPRKSYQRLLVNFMRRLVSDPLLVMDLAIRKYGTAFIRKPSYLVIGGNKALTHTIDTEKVKVIPAHSFDYSNLLLGVSDAKTFNFGNYIVYLDQYWTNHPEILGKTHHFNKIRFYENLNGFFREVEERTKLKVIIAAHPRSNYDFEENPFDNRDLVKNDTAALIKSCQFVLAHFSTAVSAAIYFKKPIVFLSSCYLSKPLKDSIAMFSGYLGNKPYQIEHPDRWQKNDCKSFDVSQYEKYKKDFLTSAETNEKNTWEIFIEHLKVDNLHSPHI